MLYRGVKYIRCLEYLADPELGGFMVFQIMYGRVTPHGTLSPELPTSQRPTTELKHARMRTCLIFGHQARATDSESRSSHRLVVAGARPAASEDYQWFITTHSSLDCKFVTAHVMPRVRVRVRLW
jgi:hypothetical protein